MRARVWACGGRGGGGVYDGVDFLRFLNTHLLSFPHFLVDVGSSWLIGSFVSRPRISLSLSFDRYTRMENI